MKEKLPHNISVTVSRVQELVEMIEYIRRVWNRYFPGDFADNNAKAILSKQDQFCGIIELFVQFFEENMLDLVASNSLNSHLFDFNPNANGHQSVAQFSLSSILQNEDSVYIDAMQMAALLLKQKNVSDFIQNLQSRPSEILGCVGIALGYCILQRNLGKGFGVNDSNKENVDTEVLVLRPRFMNISKNRLPFDCLKVNMVGQFVNIVGYVIRTSPAKPFIEGAYFACGGCGQANWCAFEDGIYQTPSRCATPKCYKKSFELIRERSTIICDYQKVKIQEIETNIEDTARVPRSFDVEVRGIDQVNKCLSGDVIEIVGTIKTMSLAAASSSSGRQGKLNKGRGGGGGRGKDTEALHTMYLLANSIRIYEKGGQRGASSSSFSSSSSSSKKDVANIEGVSSTVSALLSEKESLHYNTQDLIWFNTIRDCGNAMGVLVASLCPGIFGHDIVKLGLLLGLFGGTSQIEAPTTRSDFNLQKDKDFAENETDEISDDEEEEDDDRGVDVRSDIHVLIVGDPGLGKSQLLRAAANIAPRSVVVCGNTATTAGLTVSVSREDHGEMTLEAGALVLANQGICCIDELDKMTCDPHALLEAMEQQSISVAKSGVVTSVKCKSSVFAAANPVGGHYNRRKTVCENLKMNSALLSRFDLVFILMDKPDMTHDKMISDHIMRTHSIAYDSRHCSGDAGENYGTFLLEQGKNGITEPILASEISEVMGGSLSQRLRLLTSKVKRLIPENVLRAYVEYAKKRIRPSLTVKAAKVLQKLYLTMRTQAKLDQSIPVTTRHLESLIRLAQARARMELRVEVTEDDAKDVVDLLHESLLDAFTDDTGEVDLSRKGGGGLVKQVKALVKALTKEVEVRNSNVFYKHEIHEVCARLKLQKDPDSLIETMHTECYLLVKGPKMWQLNCA